jgi:type II secretory pathway pseudopilin PulG
MIKLFRKTRQSLLNEGKTTKYFKYAIGEIVLVVIGILIALQINNWNENRQKNNQEQMIMINLKEELKQNIKSLDKNIINIDSSLVYMKTILNLLNKTETKEFTAFQFDSIIRKTILNPSYFPTSIILNDLNNSGKVASLNNDVFRKSLYEWSSLQDNLNQALALSSNAFEDYLKYIKENASLRQIDNTNNADIAIGKSILLENNFHLLQSVQFENYLDDHYVFMDQRITEYKKAKKLTEKIILMIENQLK